MKNFPVVINDREYWISRSVAVCAIIGTIDSGFRILAVKRGKGCPDEVGKWCCPCGYLDYDETLRQACIREIKEETNLTVKESSLLFSGIDDIPTGRQNITVRYWTFNKSYAGQTVTGAFGEKDEIDDVEWISILDLDKYDWAFGHLSLIKDAIYQHEYYWGFLTQEERLKLKSL
jgi:8-oxo-dGTP diphosphatase